jgi:hypothetical protein
MIYQGHPSVRLSRVSDVARPLDVVDLLLVRAFCTFAHSSAQLPSSLDSSAASTFPRASLGTNANSSVSYSTRLMARRAFESKAACRADEQTSRRADEQTSRPADESPMSRSGMAPILTRRRPTFVLIVPRLQHLHTPLTAYTHKHTAVIAELPG